ncbi:hypothetical protein HUG10_13795 [Halorarum halophilum]|uniref:DUF7344 domain-containing protein n=1 Tax=Halorarum halophilum TaxID=2743090 RepID=A0A7D5GJ06_9EURY|nr:hypothetical protein [Halobaculum halophilum]QLG28551.1 hypothetical protein HUG10_13795 [Halobaculum halophilum]
MEYRQAREMSGATERVYEPTLSPDTVFEVLADRDRRAALSYLRESEDDAVSFETLTTHVAERDADPDGRDRGQLAVRLHHATVPRLAGAGLVEYDARSGSIRYRGHPVVERCLDCALDSGASATSR